MAIAADWTVHVKALVWPWLCEFSGVVYLMFVCGNSFVGLADLYVFV